MSKSEKIKLKGRELATRLTGILTPTDRISWKPPVDERDKAQQLLLYLAGQQGLHYQYDKEIGSFMVQSVLDIRKQLTLDIEALSTGTVLRKILRAMRDFMLRVNALLTVFRNTSDFTATAFLGLVGGE